MYVAAEQLRGICIVLYLLLHNLEITHSFPLAVFFTQLSSVSFSISISIQKEAVCLSVGDLIPTLMFIVVFWSLVYMRI